MTKEQKKKHIQKYSDLLTEAQKNINLYYSLQTPGPISKRLMTSQVAKNLHDGGGGGRCRGKRVVVGRAPWGK